MPLSDPNDKASTLAKDLIQISVLPINRRRLELIKILRARIHLLLFNSQTHSISVVP